MHSNSTCSDNGECFPTASPPSAFSGGPVSMVSPGASLGVCAADTAAHSDAFRVSASDPSFPLLPLDDDSTGPSRRHHILWASRPECLSLAHRSLHYMTFQQRTPVCVSRTYSQRDWVRLNVGGRLFTTTFSTLCSDTDSLLARICEPLRSRLFASEHSTTTLRRASLEGVAAGGGNPPPSLPPPSLPPPSLPNNAKGCGGEGEKDVHRDPNGVEATLLGLEAEDKAGGEQPNPYPAEELVPVDVDAHNSLLLDLDPDYFAPVLNYLRHRVVMIPPHVSLRGVLAVAEYLNVQGLVCRLAPEKRVRRQLLFSWGSGGSGELGTQRFQDSELPTPVQVTPFGVRVTHVALGANYSCALSNDGNIYSFGNGDWGQLGLGSPKDLDAHPVDKSAVVVVPRRIPLFERCPAVHIATGYAFAMAITRGHHVYFWGNNNHGQSGLGSRFFNYQSKKIDEPKLVDLLEGKRIVQISCGSFFTIALSEDGRLFSWGLVECLGLGCPEVVKECYQDTDILGESLSSEKRMVVLTPQEVHVKTEHRIVRVHAGQWHSGAINSAGALFTWGVGYQGRLGHGTKDPAYVPTRVRGALENHYVIDIACGSFHTVAITDRGAVFCWGDNANGQCGTTSGHMEAVTSPYHVMGLEYIAGGVARGISCGRQNTVVVMEGPQPGCPYRCCQLDHEARPRHSHAQVYTFGESLRAGNAATAGGGNVPHSAATAATSLRTGVRLHVGQGSGSPRLGSGSAGSASILDYPAASVAATAAGAAALPPHRPFNHYELVLGLERMNVCGIVSGLHHTFVYAEELDDAAECIKNNDGKAEEAFSSTRQLGGMAAVTAASAGDDYRIS